VPVEIQVPTRLANHLLKAGKPVPQPVSGVCLVDTGAEKTCVDDAIIRSLGVAPINKIPVNTPSGTTQQYTFPARLSFPGTPLPAADFSSVLGSHLAAQGIVALLGRDLLSNYVLVYNGQLGLFTLSV
jgi:hypothetical protein